MDAAPSLATKVYKSDIEIVPYLILQALGITALLETKETPPHAKLQTVQVSANNKDHGKHTRI